MLLLLQPRNYYLHGTLIRSAGAVGNPCNFAAEREHTAQHTEVGRRRHWEKILFILDFSFPFHFFFCNCCLFSYSNSLTKSLHAHLPLFTRARRCSPYPSNSRSGTESCAALRARPPASRAHSHSHIGYAICFHGRGGWMGRPQEKQKQEQQGIQFIASFSAR